MGISERMSRIRSKDTGPEFVVRRLLYGMGYRYRLHVRKLLDRPISCSMAERKPSSSMAASGINIKAARLPTSQSRTESSGKRSWIGTESGTWPIKMLCATLAGMSS